MRIPNKVLALSLATAAGPLLALAAHHAGERLIDTGRGDGVIVADGLTPYSCEVPDEECTVQAKASVS